MLPEGTRHVIVEMPEHNPGQLGGTMRLGKRQTVFKSHDSKLRQLYGNVDFVEERHRHRYVVLEALETLLHRLSPWLIF